MEEICTYYWKDFIISCRDLVSFNVSLFLKQRWLYHSLSYPLHASIIHHLIYKRHLLVFLISKKIVSSWARLPCRRILFHNTSQNICSERQAGQIIWQFWCFKTQAKHAQIWGLLVTWIETSFDGIPTNSSELHFPRKEEILRRFAFSEYLVTLYGLGFKHWTALLNVL